MFSTLRLPNSTLWEAGPYPGVEFAALSHDPASGARFLLRKFAPGITIPAHRHPLTSESVIILKGKWIEEKVEYGPGAFLYAPKNAVHGPHFAEKEVISVTWYDGPLTVENVHPTDPTPNSIPSAT